MHTFCHYSIRHYGNISFYIGIPEAHQTQTTL